MANDISNDDNLTVTALTLSSGFCHSSLQGTHDEFAERTQVANRGAGVNAGSSSPATDRLWLDVNGDGNPIGFKFYNTTTSAWESFCSTPSGTINSFAGSAAPDGWLLCDGSEVSETTYKRLYAVIADTYAAGQTPASGNFFLPDLRGRVAVGVDGSAARLASNDALAESGGAETHTLTEAELPPHTHDTTYTAGTHTSYDHDGGGAFTTGGSGGSENVFSPMTSESTGDGGAHNNLQPYLIVNHIIKT